MDVLNLGQKPIEGGNPAGIDVSYDPDFEALQAEIDKLSSPTASDSTDWDTVQQLASTILDKKSKDLRAAIYLAVSLTHNRKAEGALIGVRVCRELLENYWEILFPPRKRLRGRLNVLGWWMERTESLLQQDLDFTSDLPDLAANLKTEIDALDQVMQDKVPEGPSLRPLRELLKLVPVPQEDVSGEQEALDSENKPDQAAASHKAAKAEGLQKPTGTASPPESAELSHGLQSVQEVHKAVKDFLTPIRGLASRLNEIEPADALGYRLRRFLLWTTVVAPPPAIEGKTRIPPPPDQVRKAVHELLSRGNWDNLVKTAEARLSEHIFWLDLNRFCAMALEEMGPAYQSAAEAVGRETAFFLLRLPGVDNLRFSDGTPFADQDTLDWLQEYRLSSDSGGSTGSGRLSGEGTEDRTRMDELSRKAFDELHEGRLPEGLRILQEALEKGASQRERFLYRITLCRYLLAGKKAKHILPHVDFFMKTIDSHQLEAWEPALAVEAFKTIYTGLRTMKGEEARVNRAKAFEGIARLDPGAALILEND
jgi:type VI secretion system protein VasJ